MSFLSKKTVMKQSSIFDSENKQRPGLSSKRVSFGSTVLTDSDEENSLGRHNRRPVKTKEDDDDLLSMFKNELDDSDDDIMIGTAKKDKPNPKPRHKSEAKPHEDKNDLFLHTGTDDLEDTINPKRKPQRPPRVTRTGESEDIELDSHEVTKPKVYPRQHVTSKERPWSATQRKSEIEPKPNKEIKSQISLDDSDDDIVVSTSKNTIEKKKNSKELGFDWLGKNESSQSEKDSKKEVSIVESIFGSSSKQKKQNSVDEEEVKEATDRRIKTENKDSLVKGKSTLIKNNSKSSDDEEDSRIKHKSKTVTKERKLLADDDKKGKSDLYNVLDSKSKRQKEKASKLLLDDSDDDDDDDVQKRRVPTKQSMKDAESKNMHKGRVPAPQPRKHLHNAPLETKNRIKKDRYDLDSDDEDGKDIVHAPVPRMRRDHPQNNTSKPVAQSKLHYCDDDSDEDEFKRFQKSRQKALGMDASDGKMKSDKTAGWSSLDDSEDDDEKVGKKISLPNKARPVSAKRHYKTNNKEASPTPSPRSPRPKPRHISESMTPDRNQNGRLFEKDSKFTTQDVNQNLTRGNSRDKKERESSLQGRTTPQRPRSSQRRQNGWSRDDEDITHTFEEHVPDAGNLVGRPTEADRMHIRDHRRPQSAVTPKKGPMKAQHRIEEMTNSPQLRQTLSGNQYENDDDWRFTPQRSIGKQRSSSLTNLHQTGQPEYLDYDSDDSGRRNSLDTQTIRQTVYDNWLSRKNVTIKKELSKKALQKKKEEDLAREQQEKKRSAELAFKSWSKTKKGPLKEQQAQIKAKKKQERDKELEKELKKKDAVKFFESWKSKKDEIIKGTHKEKKKEEMEKKKKEDEEKMDKTISSTKCFENWKSKKDDVLKKQYKEKKKKENLEETTKQDDEYTKTIQNADEYQKWFERKGKPKKNLPPPTLTQRAWVPGSRHTADCIPGKVQPVILPPSSNRARTMSGTFKTTKKYYDY